MKNLKLMWNLNNVQRWTLVPTLIPDTVAAHSFRVAAIAAAIAEHANKHNTITLPQLIPVNEVEHWALMHDQTEGITGDILSPVKKKLKENGVDIDIIFDCEFKKNCPDLIAEVIKYADDIDNLVFIFEYGISGRADEALHYYQNKIDKWNKDKCIVQSALVILNLMKELVIK